jgi:hypothetical protein
MEIEAIYNALRRNIGLDGKGSYEVTANERMQLVIVDLDRDRRGDTICVGLVDALEKCALVNEGPVHDELSRELHTAGSDVERRPRAGQEVSA